MVLPHKGSLSRLTVIPAVNIAILLLVSQSLLRGPCGGLSKIAIFYFWLLGRKTEQKTMFRGIAPLMLIVIIHSDTYCKYWYIVIGVTISFEGPKRGLSKIMIYILLWLLGWKTKQNLMSHGTAPLKLIVMTDSNTCCKFWYIVVCVTIPLMGPRAVCQKLLYSTFDFWVGKLNKRLRLVLLLHLGSLSSLTVILSVNISHSSYFGYWIGKLKKYIYMLYYFTFDSTQ